MCDPVIDPEFAANIPQMSKREKDLLADKLMSEGMREPILTWRNLIVDGHNRYEICIAENIPFECKEMRFASRAEAMIWMIDHQNGRRNLNDSQRAMLAAKRSELMGPPSGGTQSIEKQALKENTSKRSVERAITVVRKGSADLQKSVVDGKTPVATAAKIATLPKTQQSQIVKRGPEAIKEAAKAIDKSPADPFAHYPEKTREAFAANAEFTKALNTLRSLVGHINAIAGDEKPDSECMAGGFWLRKERQTALTDCRNLKQLLNFSRPYAVCPYCVARDNKCECCKGAGWVHKSAYQTAPSEYKARVAKMVIE